MTILRQLNIKQLNTKQPSVQTNEKFDVTIAKNINSRNINIL